MAAKVTVSSEWDAEELMNALQPLFESEMQELEQGFTKTMTRKVFGWGKETKRKSGAVAGTIRDITDLGTLEGSLKVTLSDGQAYFLWEDEKAGSVHQGVTQKNGVVHEARPWVKVTIENYYPLKEFKKTYNGGLA
jgi:hypothetical protein